MREGILTVLSLLAAGAGVALAQSAPDNPSQPIPGPAAFAPPPAAALAPAGMSPRWDRNWERIILSAAPPAPPAPPSQPAPPAEPESPANRFWLGADYLLWWTKHGPLPAPLLTTGSPNAAIVGGLTQPGTHVLFGGSGQEYDTTSGMHFDAGLWLDGDRRWGVEAGFFFLEQRSTGFGGGSDTAGSPVLAQPLTDPTTGQEFTEIIALPGLIAGGAAITTHSRLQGWEVNGMANLGRTDHFALDVLVGFRTAKLDEDLQDFSTFTPLVGQFLTFRGQPVSAGSNLTTLDSFQAQNEFYGLQIGGRAEWEAGPLAVSALGKVALGGNQELVRIGGSSSLTAPGAATVTTPGGVLAVSGNMGRHFRDEFAVLPEAGLQVSYRVTRHLEARVGYSLLYWSSVARPGYQVSRAVPASLIPTDPTFGTGTAAAPAFQFRGSDYWAQGFDFGLALHY